jgi:hypothetical protein
MHRDRALGVEVAQAIAVTGHKELLAGFEHFPAEEGDIEVRCGLLRIGAFAFASFVVTTSNSKD